MLKFLYRLLIVGFPGKCQHDFGRWEIKQEWTSREYAITKILQMRTCKKCDYSQFEMQEKG